VRRILFTWVAALTLAACNKISPAPNGSGSSAQEARSSADKRPDDAPSQIGRYLIVHSSQAERDTVLLDTVTGKTWSRVEITDMTDHPVAWDPMPQLNSPADFQQLALAHPLLSNHAKPK
jgi:hypothetical protein